MTLLQKFTRFMVEKPGWVLLVILALAAFLRIQFATGIAPDASILNARAANEVRLALRGAQADDLAARLGEAAADYGLRKVLFVLPVSGLYALFGVNDFTSLAFPMAASLLAVCAVFLTGRRLAGAQAGLMAAFIWTILPADVYYGSTLLRHSVIALLSLLGVYAGLKAQAGDTLKARWLWLGICLLLGAAAFALDVFGWLVWLLSAIAFAWKNPNSPIPLARVLSISGILAVGLAVFFSLRASFSLADLGAAYLGMIQEPASILILVLFAGALVWLGKHPEHEALLLALWLAVAFIFQSVYAATGGESNVLVLLAPMVILAGTYMSGEMESAEAQKAVVFAAIWMAALVWLGQAQPISLVPPYDIREGLQWLHSRLVFDLSEIAVGVALVLCVLLPFMLATDDKARKTRAPLIVLLAVSLAMIAPIRERHLVERYKIENVRSALRIIQSQELTLPIYVDASIGTDRVLYALGFPPEEDGNVANVVEEGDINSGDFEGYVILSPGSSFGPPHDWWRMRQIGGPGEITYWLFRAVGKAHTAEIVEQARLRVREEGSAEAHFQLYGALINSELYCKAYRAWRTAYRLGYQGDGFAVITAGQNCFSRRADTRINISGTAVNAFGPQRISFYTHPGTSVTFFDYVDPARGGQVLGVWRNPHANQIVDERSTFFNRLLFPNQLYIFEVILRSDGLVTPLYWSMDGVEHYLQIGSGYNNWQKLTILFYTPNWEMPRPVTFSPALFGGDAGFLFLDRIGVYLAGFADTAEETP